MNKNSRPKINKNKASNHTNETRNLNSIRNSFPASPIKNLLNSKIITKDTDPYCDLSITYTNDFPDPLYSEAALENAHNSLVDIRSEAHLFLDSSRRLATTRRMRDSFISQPDTIPRNSASSLDQMKILIQSMHETMKNINEKLENVDKKATKNDEESKGLQDSIIELRDKIDDLKSRIQPQECSKMCEII
ncbi:hypothetical protein SteCoe_19105 [Stentor coeruleus]|uniref:Uncharacterized protein n=1 Tax=Stentor coeruleus TaxID=5963 RepID=A0A1R2BUW7_9CILI|nr:hypothetical protein SteCoe_19105 [Stentor coeruleus]